MIFGYTEDGEGEAGVSHGYIEGEAGLRVAEEGVGGGRRSGGHFRFPAGGGSEHVLPRRVGLGLGFGVGVVVNRMIHCCLCWMAKKIRERI